MSFVEISCHYDRYNVIHLRLNRRNVIFCIFKNAYYTECKSIYIWKIHEKNYQIVVFECESHHKTSKTEVLKQKKNYSEVKIHISKFPKINKKLWCWCVIYTIKFYKNWNFSFQKKRRQFKESHNPFKSQKSMKI